MTMDERQQRRIARNEARFRKTNELLTAAIDDFNDQAVSGDRAPFDAGSDGDDYRVMCECAVSECTEMIPVTRDEYRRARSDSKWFIVMPDHFLPAAERSVEMNDRFWIVEKFGAGGELAEELA